MIFNKILVLLYIATHLQLSHEIGFDGEKLVRETGAKLCPYTNFCQTNASQVLEPDRWGIPIPCCLSCSCEDDCWKLENCCSDKINFPHKSPLFTCKSTVSKGVLGLNGTTDVTLYKIIDSCPNNKENRYSSLAEKCSGSTKTNLDDFVWVSDKIKGTIFQNKYCAECHGIKELETWFIFSACIEHLITNISNAMTAILADECSVQNIVPEKIKKITQKYRCFVPAYTECNTTGLWPTYDPNIELACNMTDMPVFEYISGYGFDVEYTVYRNVFCYICNHGPSDTFLPACKEEDLMRHLMHFSALLKFDFSPNIEQEETFSPVCNIYDIFDKYSVSIINERAYDKTNNKNWPRGYKTFYHASLS